MTIIIVVLAAGTLWKISLRSAGADRSSGSIGRSPDSLANELYRQAKSLRLRRTLEDQTRAMDLFSRAIERDSSFARAWAAARLSSPTSAASPYAVYRRIHCSRWPCGRVVA